jgi:DNA-binding response OmpR family regulator
MRIMIADTDETVLEILQSYFWDCGYEVEIASDGLECISLLREFVPSVLVLDQNLLWGGCDGVLALMQANAELAKIPVILVTEGNSEVHLTGRLPVASQLQKPFKLDELLEEIADVLATKRFVTAIRSDHKALTKLTEFQLQTYHQSQLEWETPDTGALRRESVENIY